MKFTTVNCRDLELLCVELDGQWYVVMRHAVEQLGLGWASQHRKLQGDPRYRARGERLRLPHHRQGRVHTLMPLERWGGWLLAIHPSRVNPARRAALVAYQLAVLDADGPGLALPRPASPRALAWAWVRRLAAVMTPPFTPRRRAAGPVRG
jgi:hypothetical protein